MYIISFIHSYTVCIITHTVFYMIKYYVCIQYTYLHHTVHTVHINNEIYDCSNVCYDMYVCSTLYSTVHTPIIYKIVLLYDRM
jgi:hypothetical protein